MPGTNPSDIFVPPGSKVELHYVRPWSWVFVTPPGALPFGLASDVRWPDRRTCTLASAVLAQGDPVALEFSVFANALAARDRLIRQVAN